MVDNFLNSFVKSAKDPYKPFVGAKPKFLTSPQIASNRESAASTRVACGTITKHIMSAPGVLLVMAQDASYNATCRKLLESTSDSLRDIACASTSVVLNNDWLHMLPHTQFLEVPPVADRLVIFVGTPGKYLSMVMKSKLPHEFDSAYDNNRLVVVTKGAIMLPLGEQEQNIFGADPGEVLEAIFTAIEARGGVAWGHGVDTKRSMLERAFFHLPSTRQWHVPLGGFGPPPALAFSAPTPSDDGDEVHLGFDALAQYVLYTNKLKMALPALPIVNYYDTGLTVSVVQGYAVEAGASLLTDGDGLAMLRDASIGHIISKLNQLATVQPYSSRRGVYNFFIGDGASRLNCGMETAFHLMENFQAEAFMTMFVFNNHSWAIEDNLIMETHKEHALHNTEFLDLLEAHPKVKITRTLAELQTALADLSALQNAYAVGEVAAQMNVVVVRGLDIDITKGAVLGDPQHIRKSPEMDFMRQTLGPFAAGCEAEVPVYGCSAFEYIQYLKIFLDEMPEGRGYQYICGRTDIQAAHMCGFEQPEGRSVLMINDVYGVHSLGETLRMVQAGLGGKQLLVYVWHPSLLKVIDHFHLHRPPMVWPSVGPTLAKYFVRKESDALFVDFDGEQIEETVGAVKQAIVAKTPLIFINMLPEQERGYVNLDIRAKVVHTPAVTMRRSKKSTISSLSDEQVDAVRSAFSLFDTDNSGAIDTSEFRAAMRSLGFEIAEKDVGKVLIALDTDSSGQIEFQEFLDAFADHFLRANLPDQSDPLEIS